RHRRLLDEERTGDLARLQPTEQPQGQRDLRARRQRRVAAREDQAQSIVAPPGDLDLFLVRLEQRGLHVAVVARGLAPEAVDRAVARGGEDPAAGVRRTDFLWPAF